MVSKNKYKLGKKTLSALLLSAALAFGSVTPSKAASGSAEVMGGTGAITMDVKLTEKPTPYTIFFFRDRISVDYVGQPSHSALADLRIPLVGGLLGLVEGTATQTITPRLGLAYSQKNDNCSGYGALTYGLGAQNGMLFLTGNCSFPLGNLRLMISGENITVFNAGGHLQSTQRLRTGFTYGPAFFGPALDLTEKDDKIDYNLGAALGIRF